MYRAISLGWGVQSWTLAAMSALGELPPVEAAIHADTRHEMQATYAFAKEWTPWLEARGVRVVTVVTDGSRGTTTWQPPKSAGAFPRVPMPIFTRNASGKREGVTRRQCTGAWKVAPVRKWLQRHRGKERVEMWLGISTDEWHRAKDANVQYIVHRHPLLEMDFSRSDCLRWLEEHDLPSPGKSSCTFCPFHNHLAWQQMKRENGSDWREAVTVDEEIRDLQPGRQMFLHTKALPLVDVVQIPEDMGYSQLDLLASEDADAECDSGFCFL